jgi:hypothetical protein
VTEQKIKERGFARRVRDRGNEQRRLHGLVDRLRQEEKGGATDTERRENRREEPMHHPFLCVFGV